MANYFETLIKIAENIDEDDEERLQGLEDERSAQKYAREERVVANIKKALAAMNLSLGDRSNPVIYFEDSDREISIWLDDTPTLEHLNALGKFGHSMRLMATHDGLLVIEMQIQPGMEDWNVS